MIAVFIMIALLCLSAGIFNGGMDEIQFRDSWLKEYAWFNPNKSWMYKWKTSADVRIVCTKSPWYYLGLYKPDYVEKFPYSSTVLVFTTDGWHGLKWLTFTCYEVLIVLLFDEVFHVYIEWYYLLPKLLLLKSFRGIGFSLLFK